MVSKPYDKKSKPKVERRKVLQTVGVAGFIATQGIAKGGELQEDNADHTGSFISGNARCEYGGSSTPPSGTWPTKYYNAQATSFAPAGNGPSEFPLEKDWSYTIDADALRRPVAGQSTVFATGAYPDSILAALQPQSGEVKWRRIRDEVTKASPVLLNNSINLDHTRMDGSIIASRDADSGDRNSHYHPNNEVVETLAWAGNTLLVGTVEKSPSAIAFPSSGNEECWRYIPPEPSKAITGIAINDDLTFISSSGVSDDYPDTGYIIAIDPQAETEKWVLKTDTPANGIAAVNETIIGITDRNIFAIDSDSGDVRWRSPRKGGSNNTPVVSETAIFANDLFDVVAYERDTGAVRWRSSVNMGESEPILVGDVLYVTGYTPHFAEGLIVAFDSTTGDELWRYEIQNDRLTGPIAAHESIYFGTDGGKVYKFS